MLPNSKAQFTIPIKGQERVKRPKKFKYLGVTVMTKGIEMSDDGYKVGQL